MTDRHIIHELSLSASNGTIAKGEIIFGFHEHSLIGVIA